MFVEKRNLMFTSLKLDFLLQPTTIEVFDSLMLILDPDEKRQYLIVNLNTKDVVLEGGVIGQGPNDIMAGGIIDKIGDDKFQVLDVTNGKTLIYNINDITCSKQFNPIEIINYKDYNDYAKCNLLLLYKINDNVKIGLGAFDNYKYAKYAKDKTDYFLRFPDNKDSQVNPYYSYQGLLHIRNDKKYILYHSPFGLYYELIKLDSVGKIITVFKENQPTVLQTVDGEASITSDTESGISSADFDDESIFFLYSGRTMKDFPNDSYLSDKLFVTDYKGNKKMLYYLNRDVYMISIDSKRRRIYATTKNPNTFEREVGYFSY